VLLPFPAIILAKAPHPNAWKLFIDFVRSALGQAVMDSGPTMFFGRPGGRDRDKHQAFYEKVRAAGPAIN
jgi:hypothetical protein